MLLRNSIDRLIFPWMSWAGRCPRVQTQGRWSKNGGLPGLLGPVGFSDSARPSQALMWLLSVCITLQIIVVWLDKLAKIKVLIYWQETWVFRKHISSYLKFQALFSLQLCGRKYLWRSQWAGARICSASGGTGSCRKNLLLPDLI